VTDVPSIFSEEEWADITNTHFVHELGYVSNLCADYGSTIACGLDVRRAEAVKRFEQCCKESDTEGEMFLEAVIRTIDAVFSLCD
ncbi:hypothetical protein WL380_12125, partial [Staphylococcus epidermidis]|uniref:hypothetical protein n=1 Tax=Staphylococcus epidermidis TaxID=1282 RepID=UPI0030BEBD3E